LATLPKKRAVRMARYLRLRCASPARTWRVAYAVGRQGITVFNPNSAV
jgi:hypothetical protein